MIVILDVRLFLGMTVLTVIATDADNGNNGSVTYSLKQVPMKGSQPLFSIDSHMGLISTLLNNALDRETQSEYFVIVQAKDRGSPPLSCKLHNAVITSFHTKPNITSFSGLVHFLCVLEHCKLLGKLIANPTFT